jgi:myo-inositol-1-phosphate synthase
VAKERAARVAIIGVGNCANSFVQGVQYYKDADPDDRVRPRPDARRPRRLPRPRHRVHAAFDIDADKVGKDLSEAIWAGQNNTIKFADVPKLGVRSARHDPRRPRQVPQGEDQKAPGETADIVGILKETKTDVVVSYLPVGSEQATKWYVEQVLEAGCGFVNCIPVFIAREDYWNKRFEKAGLPIIGDDIKSQVGATIVHRSSPACSATAA